MMIMMILSGLWAGSRINTQLDPSVQSPVILVFVRWPGASAEDVEKLIVAPIEQQMNTLNNLQQVYSTTTQGQSRIDLELTFDTDLSKALEDVNDRIAQVRNLPADMEPVTALRSTRYENIASLLLTGG